MSTQFLLDEDDIKELTKLMLVMIETQESRKQLCKELGINPQEVSFIIGTSDDTFCTELIDCLNRFGYQEYLCKLCCDKLFPILNKSVYSHRISILEKIVEKLNCNCHQEKQNHPIPTVPNPDESKSESWFTKIGNVTSHSLSPRGIKRFGIIFAFIMSFLAIVMYQNFREMHSPTTDTERPNPNIEYVKSQGETCPTGYSHVSLSEAADTNNRDKLCNILGEWDIVRLANGASMDGKGYGCKVRSDDNRGVGASLCRRS